ncbi:NAD-dependent epimerase/dehydratase family protein [Candidatus Amarobacter glycogenicus]|uniref:NAD-dependent epimerase/dehydratase family protein n=1 Tax=Candidatus Amarobacter glycogenicus TaxID=3140699 RepID=UPI0031CC58CA
MSDPFTDLEINARNQLSILEACRPPQPRDQDRLRGHTPAVRQARLSAAGRTAFGAPTDIKAGSTNWRAVVSIIYHQVYGLTASSLRLTNTHGPRQLARHNRRGASSPGSCAWRWRNGIQVYGDGRQRRDLTYVDDVVGAFLLAGANPGRGRAGLQPGWAAAGGAGRPGADAGRDYWATPRAPGALADRSSRRLTLAMSTRATPRSRLRSVGGRRFP